MIKPTVGRVVIYRPLSRAEGHRDSIADNGQGHVALIAHVFTDHCVNLAIFDSNGVQYAKTSVRLVQEGDAAPGSGDCQWMPYQRGQAQKYDELAAKTVDGHKTE